MTDRCGVVAGLVEQSCQTTQHVSVPLTQLLSPGLQPLVVQVRQQVVLVESGRLL